MAGQVEHAGDADSRDEENLDRILTIPNVLSVLRLGGLGVFCYLLFETGAHIAAAVVLAVTGVTDFLDGYIARRFHQVSTLGKVLDPTADRIVVATSIISIVVFGAVPVWLGVVVLVREALVSGAVLLLAALGAKRIDVVWAGKAGTLGLMVCFPLFLLSVGTASWERIVRDVTWVGVVPALALGWYAALSYVPAARQALAAGRAAKSSPSGTPRSLGSQP
jgi:cardiolipin synthase